MSIWDHKLKKRLRQYPKYNAAVPSVSFNADGTKLAVGVSYNWDDGEEGAKTAERPAVFIRTCGDEVKVRLRASWLPDASIADFVRTAQGVDWELEDAHQGTSVFPSSERAVVELSRIASYVDIPLK